MYAAYQKTSVDHIVVYGIGETEDAARFSAAEWAEYPYTLEMATITDQAAELVLRYGGDCGLYIEDGVIYRSPW